MSRSGYDPADPGLVPSIGELIKQFRDLTGDTYRQMSERAERAGYKIKHQTIAELAKDGPKAWPKNPETIVALAVAMHMSQRVIVLAFARAFGLDVDADSLRPERAALLFTRERELWNRYSDAEREHLISIMKDYIDERLARDAEGGDGDGGVSAPTRGPGSGPVGGLTLAAAREGEANLRRRRQEQDRAGEAPDPEGPEVGA